ncbi:hypothetical protein ACM66B_001387 [Microbotryomycetes sp. NB124-2]
MAQAARNAANEQAEVAQRDKKRKEMERLQELERQKKEAREKQMFEQRRKEREERERKLEEERKRQLSTLPKTHNLYALKQQRIKRGLDPDGKEDHLLSGNKAKSPSANLTKRANATGDNKMKDAFVSREDKAARRKKALFEDDGNVIGSMALAKASRDSTPYTPSRPSAPSSLNSRTPASSRSSATKSVKSQSGIKTPASANKSVSAKDRLIAQFDPTRFVKLNTEKRDLRTIEEIEADMKRRKQQETLPQARAQQQKSQVSSAKASSDRQRSGPVDTVPKKRVRTDDDFDRPSSKSSRLDNSMRDEIWRLLGRDRSRDVQRDAFSDDDSDMEATGADVDREEQRAARIARQEDRNEEEKLRRRAEEKARRKHKISN